MTTVSPQDVLIELGLTEIEAETYAYLIHSSPATGYQIAKATGRPTPNTYKALKTLQDKGAVMQENGKSNLCRAIPPEEFLNGLSRRFSDLKAKASAQLAKIDQTPDDERVYHLHTPQQVYERIRTMLSGCEKVALLDLFPGAVTELASPIQDAASRGIIIGAKVYCSDDLSIGKKGVIAVLEPDGEHIINRWQGQWANIVVDGSQHLVSLLSKDGKAVHQAVWSACTFVSWVYHSALRSELLYTLSSSQHNSRSRRSALTSAYRKLSDTAFAEAPGYKSLLR